MELTRLLTRTNALLLQGAYQGAESFIEQAMAEADKIKSELSEIDTLRSRVLEMAAEVERLQSVIDEANAQEQHPVATLKIENDGCSLSIPAYVTSSWLEGEYKLYAYPVHSQEPFAVITAIEDSEWPNETISAKCTMFCYASRPNIGDKLYLSPVPAQQSPAVAVPECFKRLYDHARGMRFGTDWNKGTVASQHRGQLLVAVNDCEKLLESGNCAIQRSSPRITEQDAREIIESFIGRYSITGYNEYVNGFMIHHCKALIDKLNGVTNAQ